MNLPRSIQHLLSPAQGAVPWQDICTMLYCQAPPHSLIPPLCPAPHISYPVILEDFSPGDEVKHPRSEPFLKQFIISVIQTWRHQTAFQCQKIKTKNQSDSDAWTKIQASEIGSLIYLTKRHRKHPASCVKTEVWSKSIWQIISTDHSNSSQKPLSHQTGFQANTSILCALVAQPLIFIHFFIFFTKANN